MLFTSGSLALRLTESSARIDMASLLLTTLGSSSPAPWPSVSLTRLK